MGEATQGRALGLSLLGQLPMYRLQQLQISTSWSQSLQQLHYCLHDGSHPQSMGSR